MFKRLLRRTAPTDFEVDFSKVSSKELHRRILSDGCVVLRRAIDKKLVLAYGEMIESIYRETSRRMSLGERFDDGRRGHIKEYDFKSFHGSQNSLFTLLSCEKIAAFMNSLFGKRRYHPSLLDSNSRSVHSQQIDPTSLTASPIHLDGLYHETWPFFAVNFWIPFSDCGMSTDLPGLVIYPVGYEAVRSTLKIHSAADLQERKGRYANGFIPTEVVETELEALFKIRNIQPIQPRFEVGDVMLINSWTPHGTYWDGKMKSHRRNLELRFWGENWNPR